MDKSRIIDDLRKQLDDAEDEIEYNIKRKEELKDEVMDLKKSVKYWHDTSQNYMDQIKSILKDKEKTDGELETVKDELKECQEGNFYIQQYNNQLVKARDNIDAELETEKEERKKIEDKYELLINENTKLKNQNKHIVTNNLKNVEKSKCEMESVVSRNDKLQSEIAHKSRQIESQNEKLKKCLTCDQCNKLFNCKQELKNHIAAIHQYKCEECSLNFTSFESVKMHRLNHKKERWLKKEHFLLNKIIQQKFKLKDDISILKEKEFDKINNCKCKGYCRNTGNTDGFIVMLHNTT